MRCHHGSDGYCGACQHEAIWAEQKNAEAKAERERAKREAAALRNATPQPRKETISEEVARKWRESTEESLAELNRERTPEELRIAKIRSEEWNQFSETIGQAALHLLAMPYHAAVNFTGSRLKGVGIATAFYAALIGGGMVIHNQNDPNRNLAELKKNNPTAVGMKLQSSDYLYDSKNGNTILLIEWGKCVRVGEVNPQDWWAQVSTLDDNGKPISGWMWNVKVTDQACKLG